MIQISLTPGYFSSQVISETITHTRVIVKQKFIVGGSMPLSSMSLNEFSKELASSSPAPGGGSASALAGTLAASLSSMVANLTIGKKGYEKCEEEMISVAKKAESLRIQLVELIDQDAESFNSFLRAINLPKQSEDEKIFRAQEIQKALKLSSKVPMEVAERSFSIFPLAEAVLLHGNSNAVTDALVSAMLARPAVLGAILNVKVNLLSISDEKFVADMKDRANYLTSQTLQKEKELLSKASF